MDKAAATPLYIQIYETIKKKIQQGELPTTARLPSIRSLAMQLEVNKMTVETAYDQLAAEGYLERKPSSGFFVQEMNTDFFTESPQKKDKSIFIEPKKDWLVDFNDNGIDRQHFPLSVWKRLTNQSISEAGEDVFTHGDPQGEVGLRNEIASYLQLSRGVQCTVDQLVIGANSQYLTFLLTLLTSAWKRKVGVEEPGYHPITQVFQDMGYEIAPIPLKGDGLDITKLRKENPSLVFISPSHQYPFGTIMPIGKRIELLEWATDHNAWIIEDDIDSEFRYSGQPIPSLQGLDRKGRVVYMGTFFKSLLPSIRVCYMVLPEELLRIYKKDYIGYQQTTSRIHQRTIELFMKEGHWERHLLRMRKIYGKKYTFLRKMITQYMGDKVTVLGKDAGLYSVLVINEKEDEATLSKKAWQRGIKVYGISDTWFDQSNNIVDRPAFLLGFGGLQEEEIEKGIKGLCDAWF
nr:PLP-dependent aminotransferase family protein [Evansella tamaricis]